MFTTICAGVAFAAIWSSIFIASKIALGAATPLWLAAIRLTLAGLVLVVFTGRDMLRDKAWRKAGHDLALVLLSGLFCYAGYVGLVYKALTTIPSGVVSIIVGSLPVFTLPFSYYFFGERLSLRSMTGMTVCLSGIGVLFLGSGAHLAADSPETALHVGLTALAVLMLALGNSMIKHIVTRHKKMTVIAIQMLASGALLIPVAFLVEGPPAVTPSAGFWGLMAYMSVIGSIAGPLLWMKTLSGMSINNANVLFMLTPIFGVLFGLTVLGEPVTVEKVASILLIGSGVAISAVGRPQPRLSVSSSR